MARSHIRSEWREYIKTAFLALLFGGLFLFMVYVLIFLGQGPVFNG